MGAKRTGNRKYLFLYLATGVMLLMTLAACRYAPVAGPEPDAMETDLLPPAADSVPAAEAQEEVPHPSIPKENPDQHLDAAYLALAAGDYTAAFSEIEIASSQEPYFTNAETTYLSGLLYADPDSPTADIEKAYEILQGLWLTYPESDHALEGRIISDLLLELEYEKAQNTDLEEDIASLKKQLTKEQQKIKALTRLIERLKEIDLEIAPTD